MTKLGMKRAEPQKPLRQYTPLRTKRGLNRMSDKAKAELKVWLIIKVERMQKLQEKFGYVPCEYCKKPIQNGSELYCAEGHHNDRNRRNNTQITNCRIVHPTCHIFIHDHNIKDITSLI